MPFSAPPDADFGRLSLLPTGLRSFDTVADYLTAWHTVPAGRYLLLHVHGCARTARQERYFGSAPSTSSPEP